MNKRFIKTQLKGVTVHGTKDVGTRTVDLLMGEHPGEYVRGDIMDANAVMQAFDELKGNVDENHDTLEELVNEIHTNNNESKRRDEEEKNARIAADEAEKTARISGDNTNTQAIANEKQRAMAAESQLNTRIDNISVDGVDGAAVQAEATKRETEDNAIKDSLAAEVLRATTKEGELQTAIAAKQDAGEYAVLNSEEANGDSYLYFSGSSKCSWIDKDAVYLEDEDEHSIKITTTGIESADGYSNIVYATNGDKAVLPYITFSTGSEGEYRAKYIPNGYNTVYVTMLAGDEVPTYTYFSYSDGTDRTEAMPAYGTSVYRGSGSGNVSSVELTGEHTAMIFCSYVEPTPE